MSIELYLKYRPTTLKRVVGQSPAVSQLRQMTEKGTIPHVILFTGPSGCGKTTLARILASSLNIVSHDIKEVNAANSKGIDMVREITNQMGMRPLKSPARMYIIDEAQQLTTAAQDSFLKPLEDTPSHVYFAICTTDPNKLKATIKTRCTEIAVKSLSANDIEELVKYVCKKESFQLDDDVLNKLCTVADGSARKALVLLHQIRDIEDTEEQMLCLTKQDAEAMGIELCRILMNPRVRWAEVGALLARIDQDAESVRRQVIGYAGAILMKADNKRAALVLESFEENVFDSGKPGLILRAYHCFSQK